MLKSLCAALLLVMGCTSTAESTLETPIKPTTKTPDVSTPMRRHIGFNGAGFFETMGVGDSPTRTEALARLKKLGPLTIRLPGGAISKFHNPSRVRKGWGLDEKVIAEYYRTHEIDPDEESEGLDKWLQNAREQPNVSYIDELVRLSRELDIEVVWVLNYYTASLEDNLAVIDELVAKGVKVFGVEGGNEVYGKADFDPYVAKMGPIFTAIGAKYPQIQRSMIAAPMFRRAEHDVWNSRMSEYLGKNTTLATAVTIHPYVTQDMMPDCYEQYANYVKSATTPLTYETADSRVEPAFVCARKAFRTFATSGQRSTIDEAKRLFPKQSVWFTEWNLKPSATFGNTLAQGFFHLDYWLNGMANEQLTVLTVHNGLSPDIFGLISKSRPLDGVTTALQERVGYAVFGLVKSATDGANVRTVPKPAAGILASFETADEVRFLLANDTREPMPLSNRLCSSYLSYELVTGRALYSSAGQTAVLADNSAYKSASPGIEVRGPVASRFGDVIAPMTMGRVVCAKKDVL